MTYSANYRNANLIANSIYKIMSRDNEIVRLAKQAAIICCFSISNPLHVYFEDGNIRGNYDKSFDFEYRWNREYREENGEKMFKYIEDFLDGFVALSVEDRRKCYKVFVGRTWNYLGNKIYNKVRDSGFSIYHHYLGDDGNIYISLPNNEVLFKF